MTLELGGYEHEREEVERIETASEWCIRLAEQSISASVRREFEAWLAEHPANARAFERVASAWQSFGIQPLDPELLTMRRDALDRFHAAQATTKARNAQRQMIFGLVAAVTLVAILVSLWVGFAPDTYETALGERRVVVLQDGSSVSLDSQTRVEVRYSGGKRELRLVRGRARFSVAHDARRPFTVDVANRKVVATGTEFSVELLSSQVQVILYEGSVEVLREAAARGQESRQRTQLTPGRALIASIHGDSIELRGVDRAASLAWEAGQISFDDETLATAVERMNRYSVVTLQVGDAAAGRIRISGTFTAGDTEAFVEGVTGIFPVRATTSDGRVVFVSGTSP
jgi:transmembrane sensor